MLGLSQLVSHSSGPFIIQFSLTFISLHYISLFTVIYRIYSIEGGMKKHYEKERGQKEYF